MPKVELKVELKVEPKTETKIQNEDSFIKPTGARVLADNLSEAEIEKFVTNKNDNNISSTTSGIVSKADSKGKSFYEDYIARSKSKKTNSFGIFGKKFDLNVDEQTGFSKNNNSIYYFHTNQGNNGEDISNGMLSKKQLKEKKWISWTDFVHPKILEFNFRQLASLTSSGKAAL